MSFLKTTKLYLWYKYTLPKRRYTKYIKKLPLDEKAILLESQHGKEMCGNIFYILKELSSDSRYKSYKIYLSCRAGKLSRFSYILKNNGFENVELVVLSSDKYFQLLASAKYLINDNTFLPFFIKREGQVYLNTWHGTPLKTLGKKIKNAMHAIGNAQKNFVAADYLLYPNRYTMEHIIEDYMLENISSAKCILAGYPRNTIFFEEGRGEQVRESMAIPENTRVYAYMPTWRGSVGDIEESASIHLKHYLYLLDDKLEDDEILYLNLHPIANKDVDVSVFKHIRSFPVRFETYDFLTCADCLITDYSSVFYDYTVSGKKCVLFTYDEEEYFEDRGVYRPLSDLPFPKVKTVDELLREIRSPKNYDDTSFLEEYCSYDCVDATGKLLDYILFGELCDEKIEVLDMPDNGKKNVLMYAGTLEQNGITTSIYNLLGNVDTSENNYYISFFSGTVANNQEMLASRPDGVNYFPIHGVFCLNTIKMKLWQGLLKEKVPLKFFMKHTVDDWQYEIQRTYGGAKFDSVVHFSGYETKVTLLYSRFNCNKSIYVHNNMVEEIKLKGNQRNDVLRFAYTAYDNVALVTEDLTESTSTFTDGDVNRFRIVHNIIDYNKIVERGGMEMCFDPTTRCNRTFDFVKSVTESDAKVYVTVGRYSPEKGHRRMIDVFNKLWLENNGMYFVIIGGYQREGLFDELCAYVETLPCKNNVILILGMSNPLPLVKACDGFILGSFYEGFGLVIVEADILGLPAVSTDVTGPSIFMQKNNGTLVDNSDVGVEKGFRLLMENKVPMLTSDYKRYNENALEEFKSII